MSFSRSSLNSRLQNSLPVKVGTAAVVFRHPDKAGREAVGHAPFKLFLFSAFTRLLLKKPSLCPNAWTTPYRDILHTHHGAISERIALLSRMCHVDHLYHDVGLSVCTPVFL